MTLLISVLLIRGFNMEQWWYVIAVVVWAIHLFVAYHMRDKNFQILAAPHQANAKIADSLLKDLEE